MASDSICHFANFYYPSLDRLIISSCTKCSRVALSAQQNNTSRGDVHGEGSVPMKQKCAKQLKLYPKYYPTYHPRTKSGKKVMQKRT